MQDHLTGVTVAVASGRRRAEPAAMRRRFVRALQARRDVLAVIAVGGALGSLARYGLAEAVPHAAGSFAWATFWTNVGGSFAIGVLMVLVVDVLPPSRYLRPFAGVGVLGGFTTFSTAMLDTRAMLLAGHPEVAAGYLGGSVAAGLAAVWLAVVLTRGAVGLASRRAPADTVRDVLHRSPDDPALDAAAHPGRHERPDDADRPGRHR